MVDPEISENPVTEEVPYFVSEQDARPIDHFLNFFQEMTDPQDGIPADVGLPLTLSIGGIVVTGKCISLEDWISRITSKISAKEAAAQLRRMWLADEAEARAEVKQREEQGLRTFARRFVHLEDAVVFSGQQRLHVGLWRGRLARLDGWTIGGLGGGE